MTGAPTKVLVVEDEAVAAQVLVDEITAAPGFAVVGHTRSGADALRQMVANDDIDLVLLDIQLPDVSGMDVLRRLRAAGCDVDVMAVTVLRDPSMLQAAMALGVVHYLLKPFTAATACSDSWLLPFGRASTVIARSALKISSTSCWATACPETSRRRARKTW